MKQLTWVLLALLTLGSRLDAIPYVIRDCVVNLEIRNTAMIPILQKSVSIKERNGNILVYARADGYVTKKVEITQAGGQKHFGLDIVLEDQPRHILVRDVCGAPISSAYVDKSQFGFPSDVYGITVCIPKKLLPHPSAKMIQVMTDLSWAPITRSCKIEEIDGFQKVTLTVDRGDYAATQRLISVVVALPPAEFEEAVDEDENEDRCSSGERDTAEIWVKRLQAIEASSAPVRAGSALALAELLASAYSPACLDAAMTCGAAPSKTLRTLSAQIEQFRVLHRD